MDAETISISLPVDLAELVRGQVASGAYSSDSEVVRDALCLLRERADRLLAIRQSLDEAAGDPAPITAADMRAHFEKRAGSLLAKRG